MILKLCAFRCYIGRLLAVFKIHLKTSFLWNAYDRRTRLIWSDTSLLITNITLKCSDDSIGLSCRAWCPCHRSCVIWPRNHNQQCRPMSIDCPQLLFDSQSHCCSKQQRCSYFVRARGSNNVTMWFNVGISISLQDILLCPRYCKCLVKLGFHLQSFFHQPTLCITTALNGGMC